jgi:hypothetical protein
MRLATVTWSIVATSFVLLGMVFLWVALRAGPPPRSDFVAVDASLQTPVDVGDDVAVSDAFDSGAADAGDDG